MSERRGTGPVALAALAAVLGACGERAPGPSAVAAASASLPSEANLPHRINQDCGCVEGTGACTTVEERLGDMEIRNLSCRWLRPGAEAQCRLDERFVPLYQNARGEFVPHPEAWHERILRVRPLPNGRWCALG